MSPPNDYGTLVKNGGGDFTYIAKDQIQWSFDSSGKLTKVADPVGFAVTYTYSSGKISTVQAPDISVAQISPAFAHRSRSVSQGRTEIVIGPDYGSPARPHSAVHR